MPQAAPETDPPCAFVWPPRATRRPRSAILLPLRAHALAALLLALGCAPQVNMDVARENERLKNELAAARSELSSHQAAIDELNRQLQVVRGLSDADLQRIFYPEKLVIDPLSGGEDTDGRPGDDAVAVYLRPVDRTGDTVKVAGDIRIELYDLAAPAGQNRVGEVQFSPDEAITMWHGKLLTNHFTLRCPWSSGPPSNPEITIRATFKDYLTQRVMTAQAVVTVRLATPTSNP